MVDKVVPTAAEARRDVPHGASVAVGGLLMEHVARDGSPKLVDALVLRETAPGGSVDEVRDKTGGPVRVPGATGTADRPHSHT